MIASAHSCRQADCPLIDRDHPLFHWLQAFIPPAQQPCGSDYLARYFAPWCDPQFADTSAIQAALEASFCTWTQVPHYTACGRLVDFDGIESQIRNCDLGGRVETQRLAIIVEDANVRFLPTHEPLFRTWETSEASDIQGYPFDRLQESLIPAQTPIVVIHTSADKRWFLVVSSTVWGWVKRERIAWVSAALMAQWQTGCYAVSLQDQTVALLDRILPSVTLRLGQIYSVRCDTQTTVCLQVAVRDAQGNAVIQPIFVPKERLAVFPLLMTPCNVGIVGGWFLGRPYGWGGLYGYRDCSALVMDFMATFGIVLPRNSSEQARAVLSESLSHCDPGESKESYIIEHSKPFLTLLYAPGHIGLYVGINPAGRATLLHSVWRQARGAVVTDLDFENKVGKTLLEQMESIHTVL